MTVRLVDVSEFQGQVDWAAYAAAGYRGAIARAAYGNHHTDLQWRSNQAGMRAHLQVRGYYQYIVAGQDIASQANYFAGLVGKLQLGEFAIADIEEGTGDLSGVAQTWDSIVHGAIGNEEWTYSGSSFAQQHLNGFRGMRYVWVAAYQPGEPSLLHQLWQNTDSARFPGVGTAADQSLFDGTWDQLFQLVVGAQPTPTPVPTPTGDSEMIKSQDLKDGSFILVDNTGAVYTYWGNGAPGGHYLGGLNTLAKHSIQPVGTPVAANHYDDGHQSYSAYVIMTRAADGFHEYQFPTSGAMA